MTSMKSSSVLCLCALALVAAGCSSKKEKQQTVPTAEVQHGTFYIDLYEEGEIQATQSRIIHSPEVSWRYGNQKIATLIEDGTEVEAGDTVMTFDPTDVRKALVDSEQRLELHYAEKEKMEAQHKSNLEGQISDQEVSRISLEITRINLESAQYEAEISRQEMQLNLEQAEISLEQAESQIENTRKLQREEMLQMNLTIRQAEQEVNDARQTLERLTVKSPSPGIVIIRKNYSTNLAYQEGDQVWSGTDIIELPNLRELKAVIKVNEVDIAKVTKGLKVQIRPDAFSDSLYVGEVMTVANLAVNKTYDSKIKVFPVDVLITSAVNQSKDKAPDLMPGMTVSCRILVDEIPDVDYIPQAAVFTRGDEDYVYVKSGKGWREQTVQLGQRNTDYVIVLDGLDRDDKLAISDPTLIQTDGKKKQP